MQDYTKQMEAVTFKTKALSGIYIIIGQQDMAKYMFMG